VWERKVVNGENETDEEDNSLVPDSMYSLVRMFDKKKLKYFNDNYLDTQLKFKSRKFEKDTCNSELQKMLINKLVEMARVDIL